MNPFRSLRDYELFVYSLPGRFGQVAHSTLTVHQRGRYHAELAGEIHLHNGNRLSVYERLAWENDGPLTVVGYSYEVWSGDRELYWYDSQPHPGDPSLAASHPHHKHVPPEIKHHRLPAPALSFDHPNMEFLIDEASR